MMERMNLNMKELDQVTGGVLTDEDRSSLKHIAEFLKLKGFTMDEAIESILIDAEDYEECVALFKSVYASN